MTFKKRLLKVTNKKATMADILEIDLSDIPPNMTFDEYIVSEHFRKDRRELYLKLANSPLETTRVNTPQVKGYEPVTYKLIDDTNV
jgi:hypothetical protein